jgi:hypothetical protein
VNRVFHMSLYNFSYKDIEALGIARRLLMENKQTTLLSINKIVSFKLTPILNTSKFFGEFDPGSG